MSFQTGVSGLNAAEHQIGVLGNNISNAGTIGFRGSRAEFGDIYMSSLFVTGWTQAGIGVETLAVTPSTSSGTILQTDRGLDMAISNEGYFAVRTGVSPDSPSGSGGSQAYTRNGQFQLDRNGFIVNDGDRLQGWMAQQGVIIQGQPSDLQLLTSTMAPKATSTVAMPVNLDSRQNPPDGNPPLDPTNPKTFNWSNAFAAFDSLGNEHSVSLYYVKQPPLIGPPPPPPAVATSWQVTPYVDGNPAPSGAFTMQFDANGSFLAPGAPYGITSAPLTNGALSPLTLTLDYNNSSQYSQNASTNSIINNGYPPGDLQRVLIDKEGIIQTTYTNGQMQAIGQVALGSFVNEQGLQPLGGNRLVATNASGQVRLNAPGSGTAGTIQSGALEQSNVDMTAELVQSVVAQRWYQANAQTIKIEDQMLQTVINLR